MTDLKIGRTKTSFQGGHQKVQQAHEQMLSIPNRQGNAHQNHNEIFTDTSETMYHQEVKNNRH